MFTTGCDVKIYVEVMTVLQKGTELPISMARPVFETISTLADTAANAKRRPLVNFLTILKTLLEFVTLYCAKLTWE